MPLTLVSINVPYQIRKINGNEPTKHHLERLGFVEGASITVVSRLHGSMIVSIKGTRLAIDAKLAAHILV